MVVRGANELLRKLKKIQRDTNKEVSSAVRKGANVIRKEARATSAFQDKSGLLRKSIATGKKKGLPPDQITYNVYIKKPANKYGYIVELGSSRSKPHPYLRPAFSAKKDDALETIAEELRKFVDKAGSL